MKDPVAPIPILGLQWKHLKPKGQYNDEIVSFGPPELDNWRMCLVSKHNGRQETFAQHST